jgi:hypothetical protein
MKWRRGEDQEAEEGRGAVAAATGGEIDERRVGQRRWREKKNMHGGMTLGIR